MIIKHSFKNISVNSDIELKQDSNVRFFLSNKKGGFFINGIFNQSKYDGFFIREGNDEFKVFELSTDASSESDNLMSINNEFYKVCLNYKDKEQTFIMPYKSNSLVLISRTSNSDITKGYNQEQNHKDHQTGIFLDFDFRKNFDFRNFGRYYKTYEEEYNSKKVFVVEFEKVTDFKEDPTAGVLEYRSYSVVVADDADFVGFNQDTPVQTINQWIEKDYAYDKLRSSNSRRFVFRALKINAGRFVVSSGFNKEDVIKEAYALYMNLDMLNKREKMIFNKDLLSIKNSGLRDDLPGHEKLALVSSYNSLLSLLVKDTPLILAGYPWFFEEWFRDEALSLKPLILTKPKFSKMIVLRLLNFIDLEKGKLPSRPDSNLYSSDALGILALRISELMRANVFTGNEKGRIRKKIIRAVDSLINGSYNEELSLFYSGDKETWMDSLDRYGYRIEIQTLMLTLLSLSYKLSHNQKYNDLIEKVKASVKKNFVVHDKLIDGLDADGKQDISIRPNIFLAYYFHPSLFTKEEWESYFDNALSVLWLSWGGLSTINKERAIKFHTGENPRSYHNGDSWFFVNNIAAVSMLKLNFKKYAYYIEKILKAGVKNNLYMGVIGASSELSGFSALHAQGCFIQAWSNSTLLELLINFFSEKILN